MVTGQSGRHGVHVAIGVEVDSKLDNAFVTRRLPNMVEPHAEGVNMKPSLATVMTVQVKLMAHRGPKLLFLWLKPFNLS